jgi:hypothetical protein
MALDRIIHNIFCCIMNASIYINMVQHNLYIFIRIIKDIMNENILLCIYFYKEDNHFYKNLCIHDYKYYFFHISLYNLHEIKFLNTHHIYLGNRVHIQAFFNIFVNIYYFSNNFLLVNHNQFPDNDHI